MGAHNDNKSNKSYMWLLLRLPLLLLPLLLLPLLLLPLLLLLLSSPLLPPLLLLPLLLLPLLLPIPPIHSAHNCNCNYLFSGSASYRVTGPCCNCMLCVAMGQWRQAQHANRGDWMVESQMFLMDATQLFASCTPPQHSEPHPKKLKLRCYLSRCPRRTAHSTVFTRWGQASTAL